MRRGCSRVAQCASDSILEPDDAGGSSRRRSRTAGGVSTTLPNGWRRRLASIAPNRASARVVSYRHVVVAAAAHVIWRGSLVLAGIWVFRFRGAEDFAVLQFFNVTAQGMATYAGLGVDRAATRFLSGSDGDSKRERLEYAIVIVALGAILSLTVASAALTVGEVLLGRVARFRLQFAIMAAVYVFSSVVDGALVGLRRFGALLFSSAASAALLLGAFYLYAGSSALGAVLWVFCLAPIAAAFVNTTVLLRVVAPWHALEGSPRSRERRGVALEVLNFSIPLVIAGLMFVSVPWAYGRWLQGSTEGLRIFANFSIGLQWFGLILLVPSMVTRVVSPQVFSEIDSGYVSPSLLMARMKVTFVAAAVSAVLLVTSSRWLLAMYGREAEAARLDVILMSIAAMGASTSGVIGTYVVAVYGAWRWSALMSIWALCAVSTLFASVWMGLGTVSSGYVIAYAALSVLALRQIRATGSDGSTACR